VISSLAGLRANGEFSSRINVIWVVQSLSEKYFA